MVGTKTRETLRVAKRKQQQDDAAAPRAVNFRANPDLMRRLEMVSDGLELDVSSLVRMILAEHLPEYEARVERLRGKQPPSKE